MSDKKIPLLKITEDELFIMQSTSSKEYELKQKHKPKKDNFIPFIYMWEHMNESESEE